MHALVPRVLHVLVFVTLTLAAGEALVRLVRPTPRAQIVRQGQQVPVVRHGEVTWREVGSELRRNEACTDPGRHHVAMFGTSITAGAGVEPSQALGPRLQAALDNEEPDAWCVHDFAQPGYTGWSKLAEAADALPRLHPRVVLWEVWGKDHARYTEVAGTWYLFSAYRVGEDGLPWVLPLPRALHAGLFARSHLYAYGTLALSPLENDPHRRGDPLAQARLEAGLEALLAGTDARLALYVPTGFDRPFEDQLAWPSDSERLWTAWAEPRGVPVVRLAAELADEDPAALALNRCCHLRPYGHERVARALLPHVLAAGRSGAQAGAVPPPPGHP